MKKIISNFYLIRLGGVPVYVGYTNRLIETRFREHKRDKDFGDTEPTVESLGKLEYDFTWDEELINSYAKEVSARETELILEYNTQDSVWQKGTSGNLGGQTWNEVKYFVGTNRDNPKFIGLSGEAILTYLEEGIRASRYMKSFVNTMNLPETIYMQHFVSNMRLPEARYISDFVNGMNLPEIRYIKDFVSGMNLPEARYISDFVNVMKLPETIYMHHFVSNMNLPETRYIKDFVNGMKLPEAAYMKCFVSNMNLPEARYISSFVGHMNPPIITYMQHFVSHMKNLLTTSPS